MGAPQAPLRQLPIEPFSATLSSSEMRTAGIVIVASAPPSSGGGLPATLSATITARAPASWAFLTFTVKPAVTEATGVLNGGRLLARDAVLCAAAVGLDARR